MALTRSEHSPLTHRLIAEGLKPTTAPARNFADYPVEVRAAVEAYDRARCEFDGRFGEPAMSDANKATIAPMIMAAVRAYIAVAAERPEGRAA